MFGEDTTNTSQSPLSSSSRCPEKTFKFPVSEHWYQSPPQTKHSSVSNATINTSPKRSCRAPTEHPRQVEPPQIQLALPRFWNPNFIFMWTQLARRLKKRKKNEGKPQIISRKFTYNLKTMDQKPNPDKL